MRRLYFLEATLTLVGLMALAATLAIILGAQCAVLLALLPLSIFGLL